MHIEYKLFKEMPRLAWHAKVHGNSIEVSHGELVETAGQWFVEGVWDNEFSSGNFIESENFFGSGGRLDRTGIEFSSSTSLTDRIVYYTDAGVTHVSNSLVILLAALNGKLLIEEDYTDACHASMKGIFDFPKNITCDLPYPVKQIYHSNLKIYNNEINVRVRSQHHAFSTFTDYYEKLIEVMSALRKNSLSTNRNNILENITTLSTGYDSSAVSVILYELGVTTCFTTQATNKHEMKNIEDGVSLAKAIGYQPLIMRQPGPGIGVDELYFLAPTFDGTELIFYDVGNYVSQQTRGAVLWTGYHGDKLWDRWGSKEYHRTNILRGDTSGLNLSEIRLKKGFINLPVPFIFARSIADIATISKSKEMSEWQIGTDYDRPIPRRIVEAAGINRNAFGFKKSAVMKYRNLPCGYSQQTDFLKFLYEQTTYGKYHINKQEFLEKADYLLSRFESSKYLNLFPNINKISLKRRFIPAHADLHQLMFKWAVNKLSDNYTALFQCKKN